MIITSNYSIYFHDGLYRICNLDFPICPKCRGKVKVIGTRKRKVINSSGIEYQFVFRRLKCKTCGAVHLEIPDFIAERKHYSKTAIEYYLSGQITEIAADESTIRRWKKNRPDLPVN